MSRIKKKKSLGLIQSDTHLSCLRSNWKQNCSFTPNKNFLRKTNNITFVQSSSLHCGNLDFFAKINNSLHCAKCWKNRWGRLKVRTICRYRAQIGSKIVHLPKNRYFSEKRLTLWPTYTSYPLSLCKILK